MAPYDECMVAASSGLSDDHSPFAEGTVPYDEWARGFNAFRGPDLVDDTVGDVADE